jgi:hypothetical protein
MHRKLNRIYSELLGNIESSPENKRILNENLKKYTEVLVSFCSADQEIFTIYRVLKEMEDDLDGRRYSMVQSNCKHADYVVGKLACFIRTELEIARLKIKNPAMREYNCGNVKAPPLLKWTDKKVALVELIHAIAGSIDNGQAGINRIVKCFEYFFQVDLGNHYNIFDEICIRKIKPARYIDSLVNKLLEAIKSKLKQLIHNSI